MSIFRRIAAYIFAFVIGPIFIVGLIEAGLRVAGVGHSTKLLLKRELDGETFYVTNKNFYQRFFNVPIDSVYQEAEWEVPEKKAPKAYRIFVFGGSAAQGFPDFAFSFWRILQKQMEQQWPNREVEVYFPGQPCMNSHIMRDALGECLAMEPDLFIYLMGNNEVDGPFGGINAAGEHSDWSLPQIRANLFFSDFRLWQLATSRNRKLWRSVDGWDVKALFPANDPRLDPIFARFEDNLTAMCVEAVAHDVPVMLGTMAVNERDWLPLDSRNREGLSADELTEWKRLFEKGKALAAKKRWHEAHAAFEAALRIDDTHAELNFYAGQAAMRVVDFDTGARYFDQALEHDGMRIRSYSATNDVIRRVAERFKGKGVTLVDLKKHIARQSPYKVPGGEIFHDNCHYNFAGNDAVADIFLSHLSMADSSFELISGRPLSEEAEALGYSPVVESGIIDGMLEMYRETGWVAPPQLVERREALDRAPESLSITAKIEGYRRALERDEDDLYAGQRLVRALLDSRREQEALDEAQRLSEKHPFNRIARRYLAIALHRNGDHAAAIDEIAILLRLYPDEYSLEIAGILRDAGQVSTALDLCRRAKAALPGDPGPEALENELREMTK